MARVPLTPADDLPPDDRAALDHASGPGADRALFLALAGAPDIFHTLLRHVAAVMAPGAAPADLKALLAVRVAQINHCVY